MSQKDRLTDDDVRDLVNGAVIYLAMWEVGFAASVECTALNIMLEKSERLRREALRHLEAEWPSAIDEAFVWASSCRRTMPVRVGEN